MIYVVAFVSLPFIFMVVRRPVLRRLAVRNASRRPRETMLVLLGSLLGTAIITGSFVVGDTLNASLRHSAYTQLGPIDELVLTRDPDAGARALAAVRAIKDPRIDGVLPMTVINAAVSGTGPSPKAEPHAGVLEVDFAAARQFGRDPGATGISGPTPKTGEAVIGKDLEHKLGVKPGGTVAVYAYGKRLELKVVGDVPRKGVAGFFLGFGSKSPNVFVAPGTIASLGAGATVSAAPPVSGVAVSNRGGVIAGEKLSPAVRALLRKALTGIPANVQTVKRSLLIAAHDVGDQFTKLFGTIGFFSVIAGILLLVNIFVMLAEERKPELGMLRAVGLRRASLIGTFSLEGWAYAIGSSVLGAIAGIGLGRVIVVVAAGIFSRGNGSGGGLDLSFATTFRSIELGFSVGFLISLVTVLLTSVYISRLNVIRAIRDLPEPEGGKRKIWVLVLGAVFVVLGATAAVSGVAGKQPGPTLEGVPLLLLGLVMLLRRVGNRRAVVSAAGAGAVAWAIAVFSLFPKVFENADLPNFVIQGVILVAGSVALVSQNQTSIGAVIRTVGGGEKNMSLRLGLAYPLARRFRTGMILGMYSLVVFTLTFITVFSHLFGGQITQFTKDVSGGFDLFVSSNAANPVKPDVIAEQTGVTAVAALADVGAEFKVKGLTKNDGYEGWYITGFTPDLLKRGGPGLKTLGAGYRSADAVYRAVAADPSLAIVSERFLIQGGGPPTKTVKAGDSMTLRDPLSGATRQLKVAAVSKASFGNDSVMVSLDGLRQLYGPRVVPNRLFVATAPSVDADALATRINAKFLANGADAQSFHSFVNENLSGQQAFFRLMQGYLSLGLIVGIAGLGVVMVRAVRERRRQVGVLRSLGFEAKAVRRAFVAESAFVALEGIIIGVILASLTAWQIVSNNTFGDGLSFSIPYGQMAILVIGTFVASLLATAAPAQQASRIRPAVALRIAD
ncbi:MAG: putative transport system permease protein [Actinomycetota bacterium]|nr:putative transport system permease protein [Actinomycetota bacterium]